MAPNLLLTLLLQRSCVLLAAGDSSKEECAGVEEAVLLQAGSASRQRELQSANRSSQPAGYCPACDVSGCGTCSGEPCPVCVQQKEIQCCLEAACHGCSGEQCTYCRNENRKECCTGHWMGEHTGECDGVDLPDYASCGQCSGKPCPICTQGLDVDKCLEEACKGCGGEQCTYCRDDHRRDCCLGNWMAPHMEQCQNVQPPLPNYGSCPPCTGKSGDAPCPGCIQEKDVEDCLSSKCKGCGGEQCTSCRNQYSAECCKGQYCVEDCKASR